MTDRTIHTSNFMGNPLSALHIFEIFSWQEWLGIIFCLFLIFKYFSKYFTLEDK